MITQRELSKSQDSSGQISVMTPTEIAGFFKEFSWARKYTDGCVTQVYVSEVGASLLDYFPANGDAGFSQIFERVLLLDEAGNIVTFLIEKLRARRKYFLFGPLVAKTERKEIVGEVTSASVGATIETLGEKAASIRFVFSYFRVTGAVIVYQVPKEVTLPDWIEFQIQMARLALRETRDAIDAEGKAIRAKIAR